MAPPPAATAATAANKDHASVQPGDNTGRAVLRAEGRQPLSTRLCGGCPVVRFHVDIPPGGKNAAMPEFGAGAAAGVPPNVSSIGCTDREAADGSLELVVVAVDADAGLWGSPGSRRGRRRV